jgi:hypothetical protein
MKHFVVVCTPRSGSTLTGRLITNHPAVAWGGELLWSRPNSRHRLRRLAHYHLPWIRLALAQRKLGRREPHSFGFKLFPGHVAHPAAFLRSLPRSTWTVIGLQRADLYAQALSVVMFAAYDPTGVSVRRSRLLPADGPFAIDEQIFERQLISIMRQRATVDRLLREVAPDVHLVYERDLATVDLQRQSAARLYAAIGLAGTPDLSSIKKKDQSARGRITNQAALRELTARVAAQHGVALVDPQLTPG